MFITNSGLLANGNFAAQKSNNLRVSNHGPTQYQFGDDTGAETIYDLQQIRTMQRYFQFIEADTSELQMAIMPYLNVNWAENTDKLIATIQSFVDKFTPEIYKSCIETVRSYISGRDFPAPDRFETTSYLWDGITWQSETPVLQKLNQKLNVLVKTVALPSLQEEASWSGWASWVWDEICSANSYVTKHPLQTVLAIIYGQSIIATAFPANLFLSNLDGSNGFVIEGSGASYWYTGISGNSVGDANGDGITDIMIWEPGRWGQGATDRGYIIFGHRGNWASFSLTRGIADSSVIMVTTLDSGISGAVSISAAGDINGDGITDIIIGAPRTNNLAGKSYIIFGHKNNWSASLSLSSLDGANGFILNGENIEDGSGYSVSSAGDINGDGITDIIIGAPFANAQAGKSYIVFGHKGNWSPSLSLSRLDGTNGFVLNGENINDESGYSVSSAGDINGDGITDIIIGAPRINNQIGKSYVIFGHKGNWSASLSLSRLDGTNGFGLNGENINDESGYSVSSAGDINGDGITDIIIGAPSANNQTGKCYIVFGHKGDRSNSILLSNLNGTNGFAISGERKNSQSGYVVNFAGDINGDGIGDIIIGAPQYGTDYHGRSYVIFGAISSSKNVITGFGVLVLISSLLLEIIRCCSKRNNSSNRGSSFANTSLMLNGASELGNDDTTIHRGHAKIHVWKSRGLCHGFFRCCIPVSPRLGHVSMQLYNLSGVEINGSYVSAWPIEDENEKTKVMFMPSYQDDVNAENNTLADQVFEITGLDIAFMRTKFNAIKNKRDLDWKVYGSNVLRDDGSINCVGIILCLLFEGYHRHELDYPLAIWDSNSSLTCLLSINRAIILPMSFPPVCGCVRDELAWMLIQHAGVTNDSQKQPTNIICGITFLLSTLGWLAVYTTYVTMKSTAGEAIFSSLDSMLCVMFAAIDLIYWLPRALTNIRAMLCGISPDDLIVVLDQTEKSLLRLLQDEENFDAYTEIGKYGLLAKNITPTEREQQPNNYGTLISDVALSMSNEETEITQAISNSILTAQREGVYDIIPARNLAINESNERIMPRLNMINPSSLSAATTNSLSSPASQQAITRLNLFAATNSSSINTQRQQVRLANDDKKIRVDLR